MRTRRIPGVNAPTRSDMAVMHSFQARCATESDPLSFTRFIGALPPTHLFLFVVVLSLVTPAVGFAQSTTQDDPPLAVLLRWMPLLISKGFALNILISFLTMALGTLLGVFLGLGQLAPRRALRVVSRFVTRTFQNAPWLVVIFVVMLSVPNKFNILGEPVNFPDWIKAVLALSLPIMANISEIVRGGVNSVPAGQWEAAESLAYTRRQTLWLIILPQCVKRMIPPWMNWYAILTMATPLVSILGVGELVTTIRQAMAAENGRPDLIFPFFGFALVIFFFYCYPIARLTLQLERRFAVKN